MVTGIVEIVGLNRQACGGTHLASTERGRPVRILKIDNKGRHNRRIRIGLCNRGLMPLPTQLERAHEPSS
jgi:Ser-tRNA(Ala) deacylase AlaX